MGLPPLSKQGIKRITICSNGDGSLLAKSIHTDDHLELTFLDEQFLSGTAGYVRDATSKNKDEILIVFPASIIRSPKIDVLINAHHEGKSDLTVMSNPGCKNGELQG